ncbi:MATE family efflux transporter [Phycicoccus sp. M110.8]|uniref:MATE family efflux transporter n=1 Tax=Phycicoccus sp. M110.8 TaxID=3075433 RepID=UPI0028FD2C02|nr:MATE family efflux transporter [Phycicoccus sp. M110.8]MDU0313108.1 MATE family efflux transporter [Phycicoccus sp. M110.8]
MLSLAAPALGALFAEPLFLAVDSATVGHLGTAQMAGLGVASAVLLNVVLLCVFLAYGTTTVVARDIGAGRPRAGLEGGIDGMWLGLLMGGAFACVALPMAPELVQVFGSSARAAPYATTYLQISATGLPSMLLVLAATGVMRGLQHVNTILTVTVTALAANVALNFVLVYPAGMGIAGSALGTVIAQTGAAAVLAGAVLREARRRGARTRPTAKGVLAAAITGVPLLLRTALMRVAVVVMAFVATAQGDRGLAAHQIAFTLWFLLAIPPEAFGIAAQSMVAQAVGATAAGHPRAIGHRAVAWGLASGVCLALLVVVLRPAFVPLFTRDPAVREIALTLVLVVAATQPVGAVLYVIEDVLIGAGDGGFLAWSSLVALAGFLPLAWLVLARREGVVALWGALCAWLVVRFACAAWRFASDGWIERDPRVRAGRAG